MRRGQVWWRLALVAVLCCVGAVAGADGRGAEAASRPKITWTFDPPILDVNSCPRTSYFERRDYFAVDVCPGQEVRVSGTFTPDQDVVVPRLLLQTPSGGRVLNLDYASLGPIIAAGTTTDFTLVIAPPPGYRGRKAAGRIYLADRGSVLVPPLFVQINIVHPTPEEKALTPVVVPSNNIRIMPDRFNIKQLAVTSGTNVTWTNLDTRQHQVFGQLCSLATGPDCDPIPPGNSPCNAVDASGVIPCIDSGPLEPRATFTLRVIRPNATVPARYAMDDLISPYVGCQQQTGPRAGRHLCYLTVK